jgi:hypothetical protein
LDYSPWQRRPPGHPSHQGGDPHWENSTVQGANVPCRVRGGPLDDGDRLFLKFFVRFASLLL